ncbi:hypothetical protein L2U69_16235 [Zavarzinia compransoris]|uniref:hypothetical protein n=1 Tax=Zavarzinia marina TaxID=2911065 RepID=UPI001F2B93EF|nr:hypothetical protein [Zavarzinia marina]MCF4167198.1 hypothetical protein [Zavarzinia marina]
MSRLAVLAAAVLLPGVALADPVPLPTVDYSISYLVQPGGHAMDMAHHDGIMRMDMNEQGQSMTGLMNLKTDKMTVIMTAPMKMAFEMDMNQPMPGGMGGGVSPQQVFTEGDVTLTAIGAKTVAGHDCTLYDAVGTLNGDRMESKVCLTGDNVMLFSESVEGGKTYTVTATRVDVGPQDASRFRVPPGVQVMPMGAMMGALPGMMGQ